MATVEVQATDVVKIIEQYLKENSLFRTLEALQEETSINLNIVDSTEQFINDINAGNWDVVLKTVRLLKLPEEILIQLYEQVVIELIELKETKAAAWLLNKTEPMLKLKIEDPDRHTTLHKLLTRTFFDHKEAYPKGSTKERKRANIAHSIKEYVSVVPPQRLLNLLCDSLKWQKHEGMLPSGSSLDIFTGKMQIRRVDKETYPNILQKHCIKPIVDTTGLDSNEPIFVCSASFTSDGLHLIVGYSTGLVEVRNSTTGRLATDLKYQSQKNYIVTPSKTAALCLAFSSSELMAVGDKQGDISIWKLQTGQFIQEFKSVHNKGVNCLLFHRNNREILSGGHDASVKLHGMRGNKTIRDYKGHTSFVNALAYSKDDNYIVTGSSDATVKIWNAKTAMVLFEYQSDAKVHTVQLLTYFKKDIFLVGDRSNRIVMIDLDGRVRVALTSQSSSTKEEVKSSEDKEEHMDVNDKKPSSEERKKDTISLLACCPSPKGNWVYAVDKNSIYCFNYSIKAVQHVLKVHDELDNDLIGVFHHPLMNCVATFDTKGNLQLWKP